MLRIVVTLNKHWPAMDGSYNVNLVRESGFSEVIASCDGHEKAGTFAAGAAAALRAADFDAEMTFSMECLDDSGKWVR